MYRFIEDIYYFRLLPNIFLSSVVNNQYFERVCSMTGNDGIFTTEENE